MAGPFAWLSAKFASSYAMWGTHDSLRAAALAKLGGPGPGEEPANMCLRCRPAQCCRQLEVPLSSREALAGLYRMAGRPAGGQQVLVRDPGGACVYLVDELCSIYPRRPAACRDYDCSRDSRTCVVWPSS